MYGSLGRARPPSDLPKSILRGCSPRSSAHPEHPAYLHATGAGYTAPRQPSQLCMLQTCLPQTSRGWETPQAALCPPHLPSFEPPQPPTGAGGSPRHPPDPCLLQPCGIPCKAAGKAQSWGKKK